MNPGTHTMQSASPVEFELLLRARRVRLRRTDACSGMGRPVIVELEDAPCVFRLRVTEDTVGYGVMAEFDDTTVTGFDVELDDNQIYIGVAHDPLAPRATPADTDVRAVRRGSQRSRLSLTFGQPIDAAASCGEFSDGLLHLSLCKQRPRRSTGVPLLDAWMVAA